MKDRRKHSRVRPDEVVIGKVKSTVPARVVDISPEGAQIEISTGLRPNVECDVSLPTENGSVQIRARVRRCRASTLPRGDEAAMLFRAGLEFVNLGDEARQALREAFDIPDEDAGGLSDQHGSTGSTSKRTRRSGPIKIKINTRDLFRKRDDG